MDITSYIILGVAVVAVLAFVIGFGIRVLKMSPEERKAVLVTYLVGLVDYAENKIGEGKGKEKLQLVQDMFKSKAPLIYKLVLMAFGKDSLIELIEEALKQVKKDFEK